MNYHNGSSVLLGSPLVGLDLLGTLLGQQDRLKRRQNIIFDTKCNTTIEYLTLMFGRTPPCEMVTPESSLFSSSSLRMANWRCLQVSNVVIPSS